METLSAQERSGTAPPVSQWLTNLATKNGLNESANTRYLLHGTKRENLDQIVKNGLSTRFSMNHTVYYGKGVYFTE